MFARSSPNKSTQISKQTPSYDLRTSGNSGFHFSQSLFQTRKSVQREILTPVKTINKSYQASPLIQSTKAQSSLSQSQVQSFPMISSYSSFNGNQNKMQLPLLAVPSSQQQHSLQVEPKKSVFIGKGNNDHLIREFFEQKGWTILDNNLKFFNKFHFKWVQFMTDIDWQFLNDQSQIVNHISNIGIIANKSGLVQTVKEFESKEKYLATSYGMHSSQFMPETFRLDVTRDEYTMEEQSFLNQKNSGMWINKPINFNCGKGIQMVTDIKKFKDEFLRLKSQSFSLRQGKQVSSIKFEVFHKKSIIQKYLENPLLLERKKFDMRVYVFIASTNPMLVLFNPGYLRLSMNDYKLDNAEDINQKYTHLTNAAIQKKHPNFEKNKENTIWSIEKFEKYVSQTYNVQAKQLDEMKKRIKQIFTYIMRSAEKKLEKRPGCFELMGCDILLGNDFSPYLIEMNHNPALHLDTQTQAQVIPQVVKDALEIALLLHSKPNQIEATIKDPNFNYRCFQPLINEATGFCFLRSKPTSSGANLRKDPPSRSEK